MTDPREQFEDYIAQLFAPEDDALRQANEEAHRNGMPAISVNPQDGALLQWLMRSINARTVVEIGTLAGYSGIWMARALPPGGKLYTIEKSSNHASVAQASFERAGVADMVEIVLGAGSDVLRKLGEKGPFDMVFIDADKGGYPAYLSWAVDNLRVGGIVAAHNAYRHGRLFAPESDDDRIMKTFLESLAAHPRLHGMIIPLGDGMAVGLKHT